MLIQNGLRECFMGLGLALRKKWEKTNEMVKKNQ